MHAVAYASDSPSAIWSVGLPHPMLRQPFQITHVTLQTDATAASGRAGPQLRPCVPLVAAAMAPVVTVVAMMMVVAVPKPEAVPVKTGVPVVVGIVVVVVVGVSAVAMPVAAPPMAMAPAAIVDRIDLAICGRNILLQHPTADRRSACRNSYHRREQYRRSERTKLRSCRHGISLHLTPAC